MINILLVDDHDLMRAGLKRLLDDVRGMKVVAEAASGEQALELARTGSKKVDVVLMDLGMPGMGGLEATRRLLNTDPELKIIIVTVHAQEPLPTKLLKAGASGYLTKGCDFEEIIYAIKQVSRGKRYVGSEIAHLMALAALPGSEDSPFKSLSSRELQVVMMLIRGQSPQEISDQLFLSPKTIGTYRSRLFDKLGVASDFELTRLAAQHGLAEKPIT